MEETLKTLKSILKSFEKFQGTLDRTSAQISKIHNLVDEKLSMLSKDTHDMVKFIKTEDDKYNNMIKNLADKTIHEIERFYDFFELDKINKMLKDLDTEIVFPKIEEIASLEELKAVVSHIREISESIKNKK